MLALCKCMFIIIAAIQINEKYRDIYICLNTLCSETRSLYANQPIAFYANWPSSLLDGNINDVGEQTNY